jgi:hypothetical protein
MSGWTWIIVGCLIILVGIWLSYFMTGLPLAQGGPPSSVEQFFRWHALVYTLRVVGAHGSIIGFIKLARETR